ncbi:ATP-binding protein [Undibacterium sp. Di27W]|uniref:ATP-binding protein n=1 Tax=Undibacterium sp. Di27W TaxID=3413036 RepID=UPI003BF1F49A
MTGSTQFEVTIQNHSPLLTAQDTYVINSQRLPLNSDEHVVAVRKLVREYAIDIKLSLVEQTKVVTAASELARNTIKYGGGGMVVCMKLYDGVRDGVRLVFGDDGPGIADLSLALTDGYTTGGGLGLGLSGAKRLVDDFEIDTRVGEGTAVSITKWKK